MQLKYLNLEPFHDCSVEIISSGHCYELHNNADFYGLRNEITDRIVKLIWKYPGNWYLEEGKKFWGENQQYLDENDLKGEPGFIALIFEKVMSIEVRPRDFEIPFTEDICLAGIYNFDMKSEKEALVFEFMSGVEIIIVAEAVHFERDFKT